MERELENGVTAFIWIEAEGKYQGCLVLNGGELSSLGPMLENAYRSPEKTLELMKLKCVKRLEASPSQCEQVDSDVQSPCGASLMTTQSREADYVYVYANGLWNVGALSRQPLNELLKFVSR